MKIKISHSSFEKKLTLGEFKFQYTKKDGSIREALGTTKVELIPEGLRANGGVKATKGTPYFDLTLNDWRSVTTESDIEVNLGELANLPGLPALNEDEATVMLWLEKKLESEWMGKFMEVITEADNGNAAEFLNTCHKSLVRVLRRIGTEPEYLEEIKEKWSKLTS